MTKRPLTAGRPYRFATHVNEMLLPREQTEALEAFRVLIEPGQATHAHVHDDTEQLYYVISGQGRALYRSPQGEAGELELAPGEVVHVPRGTEHQILCLSEDRPLEYLCVDAFPLGIPAEEPTWEDHYRAVRRAQGAEG